MSNFISDGLNLHFIDEGEGRPILLIHGFASSIAQNWRSPGWIDALIKAGFRVIALDNRGHGASAKPHEEEAYEPDLMANDALNLMDHLGIARADFFGYSMGARISLRAARLAPSRLNKLVLGGVGQNLVQETLALNVIPEAMLAKDPAGLTDPVAKAFRAFADANGNDRLALAACSHATRVPVDIEAYRGVALPPILVVVGEKDELTGDHQILVRALAGAKDAVIPKRNHMTAVGDPLTRQVVLAFLLGA